MNRKALETLAYRHTHRDFKGRLPNGERTILVLREGGTTLVNLSALTEAELRRKLPSPAKLGAEDGTKWGKRHQTTNGLAVALACGEAHFARMEEGSVSPDAVVSYGEAFIKAAEQAMAAGRSVAP